MTILTSHEVEWEGIHMFREDHEEAIEISFRSIIGEFNISFRFFMDRIEAHFVHAGKRSITTIGNSYYSWSLDGKSSEEFTYIRVVDF